MFFASGDVGDLRFQAAFLLFVFPGWLIAPRWTGTHSGLVKQYSHALITSFLIHGWIVAIGSLLGLDFRDYFIGFGIVFAASIADRLVHLKRSRASRTIAIPPGEILLWIAILLFVVVVFSQPRSNDITQFFLQQQDAVITLQLSPSAIGVAGMGLDQAMPRWKANYWHLWPALMAVATGLPIRDVLFRIAPIPLALAALVCLIHTVRSLSGFRTPMWAVVLAVLGPVVLWYRAYNAFTYSFRLTNSFALDKDFCLFFVIPAVVYLAAGWLRGAKHFLPIMALSIPAILRFHPMTAVYLVLLTPFVLIGFQRSVVRVRSISLATSSLLMLAAVIAIGDAQSFHHEIQTIIRTDFLDSQNGRPLHYWIGQYASIRQFDGILDTSTWNGDQFRLKYAIIYDSGLFLVAHLALLAWSVRLLTRHDTGQAKRWFAVGIALATLWFVILVSPIILGRYPHIIAGYERLHWFAFVPALVGVSSGFRAAWVSIPTKHHFQWIAVGLVAAVLVYSAACLALLRPTGLANVRGLNSRLDFELEDYKARIADDGQPSREDPIAHKPTFLKGDDRVLSLGGSNGDRYWLMKQSVFWREPYAEAFALHEFGDDFLADRRQVYALVDRMPQTIFDPQWLHRKQITLLVDRRAGGDEFLNQLNKDYQLGMKRIEPGVWRRSPR